MRMQKHNRNKSGFTLIELMVVITIMGILASVAVPNVFGLIEKSREKIDLLKLYYLWDSINKALIEDDNALTNSNYISSATGDEREKRQKSLSNALKGKGVALFVIEVHNGLSINVQGSHGSANNDVNMCQLIGNGGTWYDALKEAGFDGVADIVRDRLSGNFKNGGSTYTSTSYKNSSNKTDYRTAPKNPMFTSRALNVGKKAENTRYTMNIRWAGGNEKSQSVDVFLLPNKGAWDGAFRTEHGVCFSTIGDIGCASYKE